MTDTGSCQNKISDSQLAIRPGPSEAVLKDEKSDLQ